MKTLITTLTFAAFALGATAAQASLQGPTTLTSTDRAAVQSLVPNASLNGLSTEQVRALRSFVSATDHVQQPGAAAYVRHILNAR